MPRCSYCKEDYGLPRGITLVKTDGVIVYLCSSKCRKNMLMKRRKVRWILKKKKGKDVQSVEKVEKKEEVKVEKKTEKIKKKK